MSTPEPAPTTPQMIEVKALDPKVAYETFKKIVAEREKQYLISYADAQSPRFGDESDVASQQLTKMKDEVVSLQGDLESLEMKLPAPPVEPAP